MKEPQPEFQERPAKRSKKETVKAKPKSSRPKAALEKYIHEEEQEMDESPYDALIGKGIAVAQDYNLADLSQLSKLTHHLSTHGGWELFLTPIKMDNVCFLVLEEEWLLQRNTGQTILDTRLCISLHKIMAFASQF